VQVTPGAGNILFSQTGGGDLKIKTQTANGDIGIDVANASLTGGNITAGNTGNVTLEALQGGISGCIITANGGTLIMKQQDSLNLKDLTFGNQGSTDLTVQSDNGSFTADNTVVANAADKWQSITATADSGITLIGIGSIMTNALTSANGNITIASKTGSITAAGDITANNGGLTMTAGDNITTNIVHPTKGNIELRSIGGNLEINNSLTANDGGVSLIADDGLIYTTGDTLNVDITGYSNDIGANNTGVTLPKGTGKAAIVILSKNQDLNLGSSATLTANGSYDDSVNDDRSGVSFDPSEADAEIDIAIYLGSFNHSGVPGDGGDVTVDSTVSMAANGTMAIDAHDTVHAFGSNFTGSAPWSDITNRLEVVSRITPTLDYAAENNTLPYADEARSDMAPPWFGGKTYTLRGLKLLAKVLGKVEPVPLALPKPLAPEDQGQVEIERRDAAVLGLGDKPELARAYPPSLNTDLNLDKAAQILFVLMPILRDSSRIAILDRIVVEIWQDVDQPIAPEQEAMIAQRMSGTPAEEWVAALTQYVDVMSTMVGRPKTESVLWVMQTYVIPQAEQGLLQDQTVAFLEAQID